MVIKLTKEWWNEDKKDYIFDPAWFEAFKDDVRLHIPAALPDGTPQIGKLGIVFWHEEDGKTIIPAGVTYCDGHTFLFRYHPDYVKDPNTKPLSATLPKRYETYSYAHPNSKALHPFFDNLVSEGWLGMIQRNAYHHMEGKKDDVHDTATFDEYDDAEERYKRFLMFGRGFHGAVAVVDAIAPDYVINIEAQEVDESTLSGASLAGVQPKMLGVKNGKDARSIRRREMSTHILKMEHKTPEGMKNFPDVVSNEYLSIVATAALLPDDSVVKAKIKPLAGSDENVLIIERFDRNPQGGRIHFEEALQLKGDPAYTKCDHTYKALADVIRRYTGRDGTKQLFKRLIAQLVLGNTDNHFKNFALWEKDGKWQMTPNYDLLPTALYKRSWLALNVKQGRYVLNDINPRKLDLLGEECGLSSNEVKQAVDEVRANIPAAKQAIIEDSSPYVKTQERERLCALIDKLDRQMFKGFDTYYNHTRKRGIPSDSACIS